MFGNRLGGCRIVDGIAREWRNGGVAVALTTMSVCLPSGFDRTVGFQQEVFGCENQTSLAATACLLHQHLRRLAENPLTAINSGVA
jgi:hypothetical protein